MNISSPIIHKINGSLLHLCNKILLMLEFLNCKWNNNVLIIVICMGIYVCNRDVTLGIIALYPLWECNQFILNQFLCILVINQRMFVNYLYAKELIGWLIYISVYDHNCYSVTTKLWSTTIHNCSQVMQESNSIWALIYVQ